MPQSQQFTPEFLTPNPTTFFTDNIQRFIPYMYLTEEFTGVLEFFQVVVAPLLDEMYQRVIDIPQLANIDLCPPNFLQLLAGNINVLTVEDSFDETMPVSFRRQELGKMADVFKIRGNESSFLRILKYLGATDYGVIVPARNLMILDITPTLGALPGDTTDLGEHLEPQYFDISSLCNGHSDSQGKTAGDYIEYDVPAIVVRGIVRLIWNENEVPRTAKIPNLPITEGFEVSFFFNYDTNILSTNFIPLIGDSLTVIVEGDPYYGQGFRTADAVYWRPGVIEVYSDINPLLRYDALMDRKPAGTLLYFCQTSKFYVDKNYPGPPVIDYNRFGYAPNLPSNEAASWNPSTPAQALDPWYVVQYLTLSVVATGSLGTITVSGNNAGAVTGVQATGQTGIVKAVPGFSPGHIQCTASIGAVTVVNTSHVSVNTFVQGTQSVSFVGQVSTVFSVSYHVAGIPSVVSIGPVTVGLSHNQPSSSIQCTSSLGTLNVFGSNVQSIQSNSSLGSVRIALTQAAIVTGVKATGSQGNIFAPFIVSSPSTQGFPGVSVQVTLVPVTGIQVNISKGLPVVGPPIIVPPFMGFPLSIPGS